MHACLCLQQLLWRLSIAAELFRNVSADGCMRSLTISIDDPVSFFPLAASPELATHSQLLVLGTENLDSGIEYLVSGTV